MEIVFQALYGAILAAFLMFSVLIFIGILTGYNEKLLWPIAILIMFISLAATFFNVHGKSLFILPYILFWVWGLVHITRTTSRINPRQVILFILTITVFLLMRFI